MFIEADELDRGARVECDVCVIGAGAAGITIARQLAETSLRVCVLESGGLSADGPTQGLASGTGRGLANDTYVSGSRLRYFGGSTNHWWGMCAPLSAHEMGPRPWQGSRGWPIGADTLEPYYARAQPLCQLGPFDYDPASWDPEPALPEGPRTRHCMWQYSPPTRFGELYREPLRAAPDVRVHLHANAVDLVTDEAGRRVEHVAAATLAGRRFQVRARATVLAAGGLENPRLLLGSTSAGPEGLGNAHDQVGRCFMEHPHHPVAGEILLHDDRVRRWSRKRHARGTRHRPGYTLTPEVQRSERLLAVGISLGRIESIGSALELALLRLQEAVTGESRGASLRASLFARFEQAADPRNRVTLGSERDALGQRRLVLDWRVSPEEIAGLRRSLEILAEDLEAAGAARVALAPWLVEGDLAAASPPIEGGPHHMGTTRMSDDPRHGVVDADCRVHGLENLYVAGSSAFPSVGFANPTLTLVALALRLADHLAAGLRG